MLCLLPGFLPFLIAAFAVYSTSYFPSHLKNITWRLICDHRVRFIIILWLWFVFCRVRPLRLTGCKISRINQSIIIIFKKYILYHLSECFVHNYVIRRCVCPLEISRHSWLFSKIISWNLRVKQQLRAFVMNIFWILTKLLLSHIFLSVSLPLFPLSLSLSLSLSACLSVCLSLSLSVQMLLVNFMCFAFLIMLCQRNMIVYDARLFVLNLKTAILITFKMYYPPLPPSNEQDDPKCL